MVPTDAPAINSYGEMQIFGGTSGANPNVAGIVLLIWSINPNLTAAQIRQIFIDTATDLLTPGKDSDFGNGLVNADAAVRRAYAIITKLSTSHTLFGSSRFS
ncbi:hypothetical protein NIES2101_28190 [Calothrix sp. HK-06]|nr:hypothetical protein NIES2101_28190 [Calothrix sp. HK-06]